MRSSNPRPLQTGVSGLALTLAFGLLSACATAHADEPTRLLPVAQPTVLFDGTDLDEWHFYTRADGVRTEDVCRVQDGVLRIEGKPHGYLQTRRWYRDYVLDVVWRWPGERGGNSGVLVHTTTPLLFYGWPKSLEVQLAHGRAGDFWVIGDGVDIRVPNEEARRAKPKPGDAHTHRRIPREIDVAESPLGEWNQMSVICAGNDVTVEVNGRVVQRGTRCTVDYGAIALQSEGTPIEFRHVAVRPLPRLPEPPVEADAKAKEATDGGRQASGSGVGHGNRPSAIDDTPRLHREVVNSTQGRLEFIRVGEEAFATIHHTGQRVPCVWPLFAPGQVPVTRSYPFSTGPHDEEDHPHHTSLWFAHGDVDGHDFWHGEKNRIEFQSSTGRTRDDGSMESTAQYRWIAAGAPVLDEERTLRFGTSESERWIDVTIRLRSATGEPVRFGDTKEGTFALRLRPELRVEGPVATATVTNSERERNREAWGRRARWVESRGAAGGEALVVALFDHPLNLRYPTWWHARTYGLLAANPFGRRAFEGSDAPAGDTTLAAGDTLTLRYRVSIHQGITTCETIDQGQREWAAPERVSWRDAVVAGRAAMTPEGDWRFRGTTRDGHGTAQLHECSSSYEPPHRSPRRMLLVRDREYDDFVVEFDARHTGRDYGHRDLCLVFGFTDAAHFSYVHLAPNPDDHAGNVFVVDGADRKRVAPVPTRGALWGNGWHRVRVERLPSRHVRVFFGDLDRPIFTTPEPVGTAGHIGVGSFDDTGEFGPLSIWSDSGRDVTPIDPFRPND
ncbi:MAG: DUF6807 family protein [Planctomycetota bacterium]